MSNANINILHILDTCINNEILNDSTFLKENDGGDVMMKKINF